MVQFYANFLNVYLGLISIKDYHLALDRGRESKPQVKTDKPQGFIVSRKMNCC